MLRMTEVVLEGKICTKCHQRKPLSEFDKDSAYTDGVRPLCKDCKKKKIRALTDRWTQERGKKTDLLTEKECKDCHQIKPMSAFGKDKYHKNGWSHICKDCKNQRQIILKEKWIRERNQDNDVPKEKICNICGQRYPRTQFTYFGNSKDGLSHTCKSCQAQQRKQKKLLWRAELRTKEPITHKLCPSCHRDLLVSAYYIMEGWKDGVSFYCRECTLRRQKVYAKKWEEERTQVKRTIREKECILCHKFLPVNRFYKNRYWKDGFSGVCIACERTRQQEYMERWGTERTTAQEILAEKKCIRCHRVLPITFFNMNNRRKDGLTSICKECEANRLITYAIKWAEERQYSKEDTFSLFPSFEKKCSTCGRVLTYSNFYPIKRRKDGLSSQCKECALKISKQSRKKRKATLKPVIPAEKSCKKCQRVLPYTAFTRNNDKRDGLNPVCRECKNKIYKEYIRRPKVHEKMIKYYREYSKRPEVRERQRKWARKYSKRPYVKQKRTEYFKKYLVRPEVKERRKKYIKEYYKKKKAQTVSLNLS